MSDHVQDGAGSWPCTLKARSRTTITVTMAGEYGRTAVTSGHHRGGRVSIEGELFNVSMPALLQGGFVVVFTTAAGGAGGRSD